MLVIIINDCVVGILEMLTSKSTGFSAGTGSMFKGAAVFGVGSDGFATCCDWLYVRN